MKNIRIFLILLKWLQEKDVTIPSATAWLKERGINIENGSETGAISSTLNQAPSITQSGQREVPPPRNQGIDSKTKEFQERFVKTRTR